MATKTVRRTKKSPRTLDERAGGLLRAAEAAERKRCEAMGLRLAADVYRLLPGVSISLVRGLFEKHFGVKYSGNDSFRSRMRSAVKRRIVLS